MKNWPVPKFGYGERVKIIPLEDVEARVIDLHILGSTSVVEYEVRYFQSGKVERVRVFEDELTS
jgi:hypothetical protein